MPAADLNIPGFYGKIPATGDFVCRRLPLDFVQPWDRWMAQYLAPLIGTEIWPDELALRFLSGSAGFGPAAGVILASADRVGRRFPLSLVALLTEAPVGMVSSGEAWFAGLEATGFGAQRGMLAAEDLHAALALLPAPSAAVGEVVEEMVIWTAHSDVFDIDPKTPQTVLERLLSAADVNVSRAMSEAP